MKQTYRYEKSWIGANGQRGGLTIFSAALILILMTILLVYATRVSIYETRISGNEVRQKEAFHVAEAAVEQGMMYLLANTNVILSSRADVFPDGAGTFTKDGWLSTGNEKWVLCPSSPALTHPCGGEVPAKAGSYYYDTDADTSTIETMPVDFTGMPVGTTARMSALLCFVDLANTGADCGGPGSTVEDEVNAALAITLLGYGYSDCDVVTELETCIGRATIARPVGTDRQLGGTPSVPLVAKSTVPLDGTFEVVGNPNGGGQGVPLTTWMDGTGDFLESSGSWQTCEMEEWYHTDERPEGVACTDNNCFCGSGGNDYANFLSWAGADELGPDIVEDPNFPPDLFEFYLGVPRTEYLQIKDTAKQLDYTECGQLGPQSSGLIWISGNSPAPNPTCTINGGTTVGSPLAPVIIVSTVQDFDLGGGAIVFGVIIIFDGDIDGSSIAALKAASNAVVYGAVIADGGLTKTTGTFQIVYNEDVLIAAASIAGIGSVNGGWRDFGLPDIDW